MTEDEEVLRRVRDARLLGIEKDTEKRFAGQRNWDFDVINQGWRYHMSDIMAAIGVSQLERLSDVASKRRRLARLYDHLLDGHPRIYRMPNDYDFVVPHIYVVRIEGMRDRTLLRERLLERGIQTGVHYQPNHWLGFYSADESTDLPVTDEEYSKLLTLPLHIDLEESDVEFVVTVINEELKAGG